MTKGMKAVSKADDLGNGAKVIDKVEDVDDIAKGAKPSKDIIFGSEAKSAEKLTNQISKRGWTKDLVMDTESD